MKPWIERAAKLFDSCRQPLPHESNGLDWKLALSPNKTRLCQHLSAFGNHAGGGFLVFGVDDVTANPSGLTGKDADLIIGQLANLAREGVDPPLQLDHEVVAIDGQPILFIHIVESAVKPVHLRGKSIEAAFIRAGATTRQASRQEIGSLMLNSRQPRWEELHASVAMSAERVLATLDHTAVLKLLGRPVPSSTEEVLAWMLDEKMIQSAGQGGFYVTNLGGISAARDLGQFQDLSRKAIRLILYRSLNKTAGEREMVGQRGYATGMNGLFTRLELLLPQSEIIERALRVKHAVYPSIALRELIPNALIHQDFSIAGAGPMVEVFPNRIEITNPGQLLPGKRLDRLIGTAPQSRNESLAATFRRYNICEERGSGFQKAAEAIELYGLPPLRFEEGENWFRVTLYAPRTYAQMATDERIEACYQHAVLRHLTGQPLTNVSLRERLKMPERQRAVVSRLIREAMVLGKIKPYDPANTSNKFTGYVPHFA